MTGLILPEPPQTKNELFARLVEIIQHGPYKMPVRKRYSGSGAPGIFLEDILGLTTGNKDIPDAVGWELKYFTKRTNLITLFHKEPQPRNIVRYMVSKYGWKNDAGCLSFRHTISGKTDRFKIVNDAGRIIVRPLVGNGPVPYWTEGVLLSTVGAKLHRLALVRGIKHKREVRYDRVTCYENIQLTDFIYEIMRGTVKIDFDAREKTPGSKALRNHGTKFRISPQDICRLYSKKERLC